MIMPAWLITVASISERAPIRLYTSEPGAQADSAWANAWVIGALLVSAILVIAAVTKRQSRRRWGALADDADKAFVRLCRDMRLRPRHARVIRQLAAAVHAPPVALLLCESAFMRALAKQGSSVSDTSMARHRAIVLEAAARLFSTQPPAAVPGRPKSPLQPADSSSPEALIRDERPRNRVNQHRDGELHGHPLPSEPPSPAPPGLGQAGVGLLASQRRHSGGVDAGVGRGHLQGRHVALGTDALPNRRSRTG